MRTHTDSYHTSGQNDVTISRTAAAVTGGNGRESATDFVLTAVRQYSQFQRTRHPFCEYARTSGQQTVSRGADSDNSSPFQFTCS
ncbi:hypothetical protein E2L06_14815 [Haloterrigena sp. H1]|nr:hypothetical protein E2L06_14815 [Haloterrigena sp. H1]